MVAFSTCCTIRRQHCKMHTHRCWLPTAVVLCWPCADRYQHLHLPKHYIRLMSIARHAPVLLHQQLVQQLLRLWQLEHEAASTLTVVCSSSSSVPARQIQPSLLRCFNISHHAFGCCLSCLSWSKWPLVSPSSGSLPYYSTRHPSWPPHLLRLPAQLLQQHAALGGVMEHSKAGRQPAQHSEHLQVQNHSSSSCTQKQLSTQARMSVGKPCAH